MPRVYCRYLGCRNGSHFPRIEGKELFNFPIDEDRCQQWIKGSKNPALGYIPARVLHKVAHLCEDHFAEWCFVDKVERDSLVSHAIPDMAEDSSSMPKKTSDVGVQGTSSLPQNENDVEMCGSLSVSPNSDDVQIQEPLQMTLETSEMDKTLPNRTSNSTSLSEGQNNTKSPPKFTTLTIQYLYKPTGSDGTIINPCNIIRPSSSLLKQTSMINNTFKPSTPKTNVPSKQATNNLQTLSNGLSDASTHHFPSTQANVKRKPLNYKPENLMPKEISFDHDYAKDCIQFIAPTVFDSQSIRIPRSDVTKKNVWTQVSIPTLLPTSQVSDMLHEERKKSVKMKSSMSKTLKRKNYMVCKLRQQNEKLREKLKAYQKPDYLKVRLKEMGVSEKCSSFLLRQAQLDAKRPNGRQFTLKEKIFAYQILCCSPNAYCALKAVMVLPSKNSIKNFEKAHLPPNLKSVFSTTAQETISTSR